MVPERFYDVADELEQSESEMELSEPSKTYDLKSMKSFVDEREAVSQAVVKILNTERFRYSIYSTDYGLELDDLIGLDCDYVAAELERRIDEALTADERITGVSEFDFVVKKNTIHASFTVHSVYGDFDSSKEFVYV